MIKLIEGARNSGKSYLLKWANVSPYKFDFPFWYGKLKLNNKDRETHSFALSKEIILHELNRDGLLAGDIYVDRGILTVLVWGVLKDRITIDEAIKQLWHFSKAGLFKDCEVIYIHGDNPRERGSKDLWDDSDRGRELEIYEVLLEELKMSEPKCKISRFRNGFNLLDAVIFRNEIILKQKH
jgi:hypothetical protein